jgi:hypothetical protein
MLTDEEALRLALKQCRTESRGRAGQIDAMLVGQPWVDVARFAAASCQETNLKLKPWQLPPCAMGPGDRREHKQAAKLLDDMLVLGVSRWHPDPAAAIAEASRPD